MDIEKAEKYVTSFNEFSFLVVGDAMLDQYRVGKVERLNPEAPVPILHISSEEVATGGAGNTAKNIASLNAEASLVSVVGADEAGKTFEETAIREGYKPLVVHDKNRPTTQKRRYLAGSQQMLRVDDEVSNDIDDAIEKQLIAVLEEYIPDVDAVIVSDYAKGVITPRIAEAVMRLVSEHNKPLMADVKPSRIQDFKGATYISPNRKEAHEYLGLNELERGGKTREEIARLLRDTFMVGVFLTLSDEGMYVLTKDTPEGVHVPQPHKIQVADTSGCGDTAAVAIMLSKLAGASDAEAAYIANTAAAVVATKVGAASVTQEELLSMFKDGHH